MYTVRLNSDKTVTTIINQRVSVDYQAEDWFWFLLPDKFQGKKASSSLITIEYTLPVSNKTKTEILTAKNEYYGSNLKYTLPKYSKLTNESGTVKIKIVYTDNYGSIKSDTFNVGISTDEDYHDDKNYDNPELDGSGYDEKGCSCDEQATIEKILNKIRPLIYDSVETATTSINSDDIEVFLGQNLIIVQNGKYLLYSVQQGENGYSVEPVDTYGEAAVWTEDDDSNDSP